jgi:hypothetical protein
VLFFSAAAGSCLIRRELCYNHRPALWSKPPIVCRLPDCGYAVFSGGSPRSHVNRLTRLSRPSGSFISPCVKIGSTAPTPGGEIPGDAKNIIHLTCFWRDAEMNAHELARKPKPKAGRKIDASAPRSKRRRS